MTKRGSDRSAISHGARRKFFVLSIILVVAAALMFYMALVPAEKQEQVPSLAYPPLQSDGRSKTGGLTPQLEKSNLEDGDVIQTVLLKPSLPTRLHTLHVEVTTKSPQQDSCEYSYEWMVNHHIIKGVSGDSLDLSEFKINDIVTVTVTPYVGTRQGFSVRSQPVVVQSIPPTLELKSVKYFLIKDEPITLQLISEHPDSEIVKFSLEEPLVAGMRIDEKTGKITWHIQHGQEGVITFRAAVLDNEEASVSKSFEVNIGRQPNPPIVD